MILCNVTFSIVTEESAAEGDYAECVKGASAPPLACDSMAPMPCWV